MIKVQLDEPAIAFLFPAFIAVDLAGVITATGPAIGRLFKSSLIGSNLTSQFRAVGHDAVPPLAELAARQSRLQLDSVDMAIALGGCVLPAEGGFLLALGLMPSIILEPDSNLQMSDFGPSDPAVYGLMLVGLQQAMLDEARLNALDLARERQRTDALLNRISRVAGYMAHDLNNFLSIIRLNGERLLKDSGLAAAQRRVAGIIKETAERGSEIARSLLAVSQHRDDPREAIVVDELISAQLGFLTAVAGSRIRLHCNLDAAGAAVELSRAGLINCLMNILVNARDAMPDGGDIEITTAVKTLTGESRPDETGTPLVPFITLRVADTGIGMPPPVLARAFEPFFSTKSHGSGVGLASVLEFARAHGGDACLDSLEAVGTSVYLYLPLCHRDGGVGNSDGHATPALVPPQPAAILVVEDEPYALEALVEILEADGHAVTAALNAGEALAALADRPYAVVLSDVILPDGSGLAVAAWADTHAPATEVVLMSGFVPSDEALRPHWRFVHKPLDIPQLRQVLAEALGAATLRAQSDRQATRSSAPSSG